ncbi:recombination protein NinB [Endozoicomonas sp. Mp262]|uniref:recombination protein NinB n=1 Tax=Endozoicomonas sp. Mp262 TaxID=2919499 RepID=UPI0021DAA2FA
MDSQKIVIATEAARRELIKVVNQVHLKKPVEFSYRPFKPKRSLSANALYWKWLSIIERKMTGKCTKEGYHLAFKHLFLGYEDVPDIGIEIPAQLKSTTKLNKTEFCEYMTRIDAWAVDAGIRLPRPEDSVYDEYLRGRI